MITILEKHIEIYYYVLDSVFSSNRTNTFYHFELTTLRLCSDHSPAIRHCAWFGFRPVVHSFSFIHFPVIHSFITSSNYEILSTSARWVTKQYLSCLLAVGCATVTRSESTRVPSFCAGANMFAGDERWTKENYFALRKYFYLI